MNTGRVISWVGCDGGGMEGRLLMNEDIATETCDDVKSTILKGFFHRICVILWVFVRS